MVVSGYLGDGQRSEGTRGLKYFQCSADAAMTTKGLKVLWVLQGLKVFEGFVPKL